MNTIEKLLLLVMPVARVTRVAHATHVTLVTHATHFTHQCATRLLPQFLARLLPLLLPWFLLPCATPAQAGPVEDAIRAGGVALLIRHASAPGSGDPEHFKLDDCSTQRNLSESGRSEARQSRSSAPSS